MKRIYCDRCNHVIETISPMANVTTATNLYPEFDISLKPDWNVSARKLDLCHTCSLKLYNFLMTPPDEWIEKQL